VPHQNIVFHCLLKHIPWPVLERLVDEHNAEPDPRGLRAQGQLIAMLYGQLFGASSLREIANDLKSHASKLYHLGGCTVSKSALSTANKERPSEVFTGLLSAMMKQFHCGYRRKIRECVRLIDSTSVRLSSLSGNWARFSTQICGAKAHIVYDPDSDQPLYLLVTAANVNDITAAKAMPVEPRATYVFDLGYYDYAWWAKLHAAACTFVTRLKRNTPFSVVEERSLPPASSILSDRTGYLPRRLAASRNNPMSDLVREIRVVNENGKELLGSRNKCNTC
jgi:hypothetical protein